MEQLNQIITWVAWIVFAFIVGEFLFSRIFNFLAGRYPAKKRDDGRNLGVEFLDIPPGGEVDKSIRGSFHTLNGMKDLCEAIYRSNEDRGFWGKNRAEKYFLSHQLLEIMKEAAEASDADKLGMRASIRDVDTLFEALEEGEWVMTSEQTKFFKNNIKGTFEDELADIFIRLMDLHGGYHVDLRRHVIMKLLYNETRGNLHGKKY